MKEDQIEESDVSEGLDGLLPMRSEVEPTTNQTLIIESDEQEKIKVLSSESTREVLESIQKAPKTPAEVRDELGNSLQNAHYHVGKLEGAGLIEAAGTAYSENGVEMDIYRAKADCIQVKVGPGCDID
ncbi:ArsR/SmtB family transcription factor [Halocatena halophila]|uniref:ArsR/SmtB family transcription factor n=1 Tax=Halocatena halophila TaxID=2814576 RepID=UPI002ED1326C